MLLGKSFAKGHYLQDRVSYAGCVPWFWFWLWWDVRE
jgi:hypothetical protein